jgi:hypothetical protein
MRCSGSNTPIRLSDSVAINRSTANWATLAVDTTGYLGIVLIRSRSDKCTMKDTNHNEGLVRKDELCIWNEENHGCNKYVSLPSKAR